MADQTLSIPWGSEQMQLRLPREWEMMGVMAPASRAGVADVEAEVRRSLAAPIGLPRLAELARPGMKVLIVVDDDSRPTPVARLMPHVLAELQQAGVPADQITLMAALGVHRPMSEAELARRVGAAALAGMRWETHACDDEAQLATLGVTRRGTPVAVNRTAAQADLVVSIGCIEPHLIASFGGGYKNLVPGLAGRATIAHNHALNCRPEHFNSVGQPIDRNPMRLDLEEAAAMLRPPVFVVNAVLNSALEVVQVVSGHPVAAHREGARVSAQIYGVAVPAQADVVITSSHPMDHDLRQGVKALGNVVCALRPGGVMITLIRAVEGLGVFGLANTRLPVGRSGLQLLAPALLPLVPRLKVKGLAEDDRFFLYFALQAMRRGELLIYAPTVPAEIHARLPFVLFMGSPEAALARARRKFPRSAKVAIFPHGGSTFPICPEGNHD